MILFHMNLHTTFDEHISSRTQTDSLTVSCMDTKSLTTSWT